MAFQSRLDFVAKSALFRPFHFAIVEDASVDRRAVTARRALERETRATEPARARDRETARARARRRRRRGSSEGRAGTTTTTRRDARRRARRDGERASDGVWIRKARERADGGDRDARGEGEDEDERGRREGGRRVGVGTRERRVEERAVRELRKLESRRPRTGDDVRRRRGADVRATTRKHGGFERADDGGGADDSGAGDRGARGGKERELRARRGRGALRDDGVWEDADARARAVVAESGGDGA